MTAPRQRFGLTLVVNHACNLRCSYCYTGAKFNRPMPREVGLASIDRALHSLAPGGHLDLGFFGGEPLLECAQILEWMTHARNQAWNAGKEVGFNITTNGTIAHNPAWRIMMAEDLELAISFDGSPEMHDRHRRDSQGHGTASRVVHTLQRLLDSGRTFQVVVVVRPDNLEDVPEGLRYLHQIGVRQVNLSLDLWTTWSAQDAVHLRNLVFRAAELWRQWLPEFSLNWFDAKAGELAHLAKTGETTRCGFGDGEIAVAPSGRLYPCERLVGEDRPNQPLVLPGHALQGDDFLESTPAPFRSCPTCSQCMLAAACDTVCRCGNFVRTGDVNRPDGLLCLFNKATAAAVAEVLGSSKGQELTIDSETQNQRPCYVA